MKPIFLLLLFCSFTTKHSLTEKYYVTFVKGSVIVSKTKLPVKIGDVLTDDDRLIFKDLSSKVSCIHPTKGRYDITPLKGKSNADNELVAMLKSSLTHSAVNYSLSTRSIGFDGNDPLVYFKAIETQGRILFIENEPFSVKTSYKMDDKNFFFIQFEDNGTTVAHKIKQNNFQLFFSKENFLTSLGIPVETASIFYQSYDNGLSNSTIIADFKPVLATKEEISNEINLIEKVAASKDKKKVKSEIVNHLFDNYGKIDAERLMIFTYFKN